MTMPPQTGVAYETDSFVVQGIGRSGVSLGVFSVGVEISAPAAGQPRFLELIVDTGATYTVIPQSALHDIGVVPKFIRRFLLADGRGADYPMGEVLIRVEERECTTQVVFGEDTARALLGATTLQELSLAVDSDNERLFPIPPLR